ncbi:destruxin synthetase [Fusarium flagelliforme]|uniref:Destruxin synthetase n=1 Tax=Fusarium flagelliforme TaxID=2675880 RepID=A0A395MAR9_9HYPO|nr:destruxin synthetase [Fusarium flagelliforme]
MEQSVLELAQGVSDEDITTAWAKVVEGMPILRTRFVHYGASGLLQLVLEKEMSWQRSNNLDEYLKLDRARPMSLVQPFTRYCPVRSHDSGQRWFVWTAHHALYDGWSVGLIKDAMRTALHGESVDTGPQFQSFIRHVRTQDEEAVSEYWRGMLDTCESLTFPNLPPAIDQPLANNVVQHNFSIPMRQPQDITTTSMVHAAWALITGRINNSDEAIFGITTSGRNAPVLGIEAMVAPTLATIPLRAKICSNEKVSDYLRAIQKQSADVVPFEQSLLVIQRKDTNIDDQAMGTWQTLSQHKWLNTYALMLEIRLEDQGIHISASFDDRIVDKQPHMDLPEPSEQLVHDIIHQRAQDHPDVPAIFAWDSELSYTQLDQLTSRISKHLSSFGLEPDTLVPLCFEKSMWTAVAALPVLKAGAGFALLEPNLPEERLQTIVSQLDTDLILSSQSNAPLSGRFSKTVVQMGPELAVTLDDTSIVDSFQQPSDAMFAVFTSGTTGKPKCVVLSHSNFCSELEYQAKALGFNPNSRVFDFAAYSFDITVHNIFATFATGGCLCVPAEKDRWGNTSKAMADMKVTLADLTPSVARLIDPLAVPTLEALILAGEAVSLDDVTRWWGRARVVNGYGPAECQISTVNENPSTPEEAIRIGKGMGLLTWVVDQYDHKILLPPGYIGELLLEGPLASRGYLSNPEETATKFIRDPIWLLSRGSRMYKTGDLVRYNDDGSLTYVGRKDTQVKIRGQRVELGEVEHYVQGCLAETATIVAEVITPHGGNTSPMLVIFVEDATNDASTGRIVPIPPNLDAKLSKRRPRHMKPSAFIHVSVVPRTATGKTDRKQLQQIGASFSVQDLVGKEGVVSKKQPTSDTERKMQRIWAEVLGVDADTIGVEDNFFQLGGDSIAVLKVVEKARKIGLELAVMDAFHHPSLSIGART